MSFYKATLLLAALSGTFAQDQSQQVSAGTSFTAPSASAAAPSGTVPSAAGGSAQAAPTSISIAAGLPSAPLASDLPGGITIPYLSELTSGAPSGATAALDSTYTQGATPTDVSGAPASPTGMLTIANYPELDRVPPVDSPEVQQWLSQIDLSGVPSYAPSTGDCSTDPGAITDGRCWWTCGGCTRETDIVDCPDELTWGTSYDDGPSPYTPLLLDYLNKNDLKTTFFVVGSRVLSRPEMLLSEYMSGHQISIHTWSHSPLTTLSNEEIVAELGWTAKVIRDVIGVTPNTFRPPYGDIDDRVRYIAAQMNQTPIMWTGVPTNNTVQYFDTTDWNIPGNRATGESALSKFETILNDYVPQLNSGFIVLQHDIYQQTVDLAVGYILPMAIASGKYQLKSIIDCLGLPNSEAYVETSSNNTATQITSAESTVFQPQVGSATGSPVAPSGVSQTRSDAGGSASSGGSNPSSSSSSGNSNSASKLASGLNLATVLVAAGAVFGGMAIVA